MWTRITRIFFNLSPLVADRRSETRAPALAPLPLAHSAAGGERLYATGVADERDHDSDAADEEDALHHMHAVRAQIQVAGDRPATGEGGAENLRADQNGRAEHGQYVLPGDLASLAGARWAVHASAPMGGAICANGSSESSLGLGSEATKSPNCGAAPRRTSPSRGIARLRVEEPGLRQRRADALDLDVGELDQRRPHHGPRQAAEQHQRLLHAVVHVGPGVGVEHPRQRIDAVVEAACFSEIVGPDGVEQLRLQVRDHAATAGEEPVAAEHEGAEQPSAVGAEHAHRAGQALQGANVHLMLRHVARPILDGADAHHLVGHLEERVHRVALARGERILEHDERQVGRVRDAFEMSKCHLRRLSQREGPRREDQQRRGAAVRRHAGDPGRLDAAIRPHPVDQRQALADLVLGDGEHAPLLLEAQRGDLGRMRVDGDGGDPLGRRDVPQMGPEALFVDGKVIVEGQQHGRNDAVGLVAGVTGHGRLLGFPPVARLARGRGRSRGGRRVGRNGRWYWSSAEHNLTPHQSWESAMNGYRRIVRHLWMVLALVSPPAWGGAAFIYVTNSAGDSIHVIDPATNKVVQEIKGIEAAHGIAPAPDGARVYVSNEADSTLDVFDRASGALIKKVPLSNHPNNIAVTKAGDRILVGIARGTGAVDVIDASTLTRTKSIPVNGRLHNIYVTPDGKRLITGSIPGKLLTVIDLEREVPIWELALDKGVRPMAIEAGPDGATKRIFVQLSDTNGFAVVDFAARKEVARITLPEAAVEFETDAGR